MTDENDEARTPFGSIGGEDQPGGAAASPPPPPASQAPTSPIVPASIAPPVAPTPPAPTAAGGFAQQASQHAPYQPPQKKSKVGWIIGGVVLLLFVLGGAVISVLAFASSDGDDDTVTTEIVEPDEPAEVDDEIDSDTGTEVDDADGEVEPEDEVVDETADEDDDDVLLGTVSDPVEENVSTIEVADGDFIEISAEIAPNGFDVYLIELEAGSSVEVTAQSSGEDVLDSMMRVLDPGGSQISFNDDNDSGLFRSVDPQVSFVAETAGTYTVEVLGFNAVTAGEYLLTVNRTGTTLALDSVDPDNVGDDEPLPQAGDDDEGEEGILGVEDDVTLTVGPNEVQVVEGSIEDTRYVDLYELDLQAGETVRIAAVADPDTELDLAITVFDFSFNLIGFDDDVGPIGSIGSDRNPEIEFFAPTTDTFLFDLLALSEATGSYTLTVERGEVVPETLQVDELQDLPSSLFLERGESVTVTGSVSNSAAFDLILEIGDEVTVTVEAADPNELDPTVTMEFGGWVVDYNDDALDPLAVNSEFDSQINLTTGNAGIHTILVNGFDGSAGEFTMVVERS